LRYVEGSSDPPEFVDINGGFDKEPVRACAYVSFAASERLVEVKDLARIRPSDNERLRLDAILCGGSDIGLRPFLA
jgi:hypothetical protein